MTITYHNGNQSIELTYSDDLETADFLAVGFDPSDDFVLAAVEAGGSDFTFDSATWTSEIN